MKYWKIEGFDGTNKIYEKQVKLGNFSDSKIKELLRALVARASLSFDEIIGAYAKKRTNMSNDLLLIQKDGLHPRYLCGENPFFTARVVNEIS